jgi:membrane protease YdiL (CAAX protease family)
MAATGATGPAASDKTARAWLSPHQVAAYVVLAYAFSWAWWVPMAVAGTTTQPGQAWPTHLPGRIGPALSAVVVTAVTTGADGLRDLGRRAWRWRVSWRWYAVVVATGALLVLAPIVAAVTSETQPSGTDYVTYSGLGVLPAAATFVVVLVVNGFGEEVGWRGFLADRLLPGHGVLRTGLLVAPVWALWHLPMFFYVANLVELGPAGAVGWFVGLTAGSVLLTWLYQGSGRSIAIVALWHATFNMVTATAAGNGVPAAAASTLVMVAAVVIGVRDWRRRPAPPVV